MDAGAPAPAVADHPVHPQPVAAHGERAKDSRVGRRVEEPVPRLWSATARPRLPGEACQWEPASIRQPALLLTVCCRCGGCSDASSAAGRSAAEAQPRGTKQRGSDGPPAPARCAATSGLATLRQRRLLGIHAPGRAACPCCRLGTSAERAFAAVAAALGAAFGVRGVHGARRGVARRRGRAAAATRAATTTAAVDFAVVRRATRCLRRHDAQAWSRRGQCGRGARWPLSWRRVQLKISVELPHDCVQPPNS